MEKTNIIVHKKFQKGRISPEIYGSFVEHMGRVVYSGIYEPTHRAADADGFREDVRAAVKEMGVTAVRYPGGNFVSNYDWRDGVGPREKRPRKVDLAWKSIETNEVGTDEFMKWAKKTGIDPIFAVNLGTGGVKEAVSLLEYCNFPVGDLLGGAIAGFTTVVDPEAIVIGGGVSKAGQPLIDCIEKYYQRYAFSSCKETPIVLATLGNDAGIYGAAKMVL